MPGVILMPLIFFTLHPKEHTTVANNKIYYAYAFLFSIVGSVLAEYVLYASYDFCFFSHSVFYSCTF